MLANLPLLDPMLRPLFVAAYLLSESFEGTGYENSWTEAGTPNEDYTTVVLDGSQSLGLVSSGDSSYASFAAQSSVWFYCMFRFPSATNNNTSHLIQLRDSGGAEVCGMRFASGGVYTISHGTANASSAASAYASATTYHIWLHYTKGTGANGTLDLYFSSTSTQPGSPSLSITTGTATADAAQIFLQRGTTIMVIDKVRVSASAIGSAPT